MLLLASPRLIIAMHHVSQRKFRPFTHGAALLAAMSTFSFAQRLAEFGVGSIMIDFLTYYRGITDFLFGWLANRIDIPRAYLLPDLWALSFIGAGLQLRAFNDMPRYEGESEFKQNLWQYAVTLAFIGISGFGLIAYVFLYLGLKTTWSKTRRMIAGTPDDDQDLHDLELSQAFFRQGGLVILYLAVLFVMNAYAPSATV